jgi:hypothetical protein
MQVFDDLFQAESGWNCSSSKTYTKLNNAECTYTRELLMMGKEVARNM